MNRRPALTLVAGAAALLILAPGCKKRRPGRQDPCRSLVKRQLACLRRDRPGAGPDRRTAELEGAVLQGRAAVGRCRRWRTKHPDLFRKLQSCLKVPDCQGLETCFQDLYTIHRARQDLAELERQARRPSGEVATIPLPCREAYTRSRLRRIGTAEAKDLARRIEHHCVKKSSEALTSVGQELDRMVKAESLARLTDLCNLVRQMVRPRKPDSTQPGFQLPADLSERASSLDRLCKERHHIQRVLNRLSRIRKFLAKGQPHALAKTCAAHGRLADRLIQMGEPALLRLAASLKRACGYEVPLEWVAGRMAARRRPGKITCRMSSEMVRDLLARYPDDPAVHVAEALTRHRCAPGSR